MLGNFTVLYRIIYSLSIGISILFLSSSDALATHAMGSDLTYRCLGGDTYEITLTIYRDCVGSALTPTQNIEIRSASCGIPNFIERANRVSVTELSPLCPIQQPLSTCNGGPLPGIEEHKYTLIYTFPQECTDWQISWQLCCRNFAITNSVINTNTRMYIEAFLNNTIVTCNSSPTFTVPPVPYLCDGELFFYNNGAVDPDGDSLAFELTDPFDYIFGVPTLIPYQPGFSATVPMATRPVNNVNFNTQSGQFTFTPDGLQQGIVALRVKEYRKGVLIGTTMRDLQMVVINCFNQAPTITPPFNILGGQYNGNTFSVCAGNTLEFDLVATDPDQFNVLSFTSSLAIAIPGATITLAGTNPLRIHFSWPTTVADIGNYFFTSTVEDDGCPLTARLVIGANIIVQMGEVLPSQERKICPVTTQNIQLNSSIPNSGGTYSWSPTTGLSNPNIRNPIASVDSSATYTVTYQPAFGCPIIEPFEITSEGTIEVETDSLRICLGDSAQLQATFTLNGPPVPVTFNWEPLGAINDPTLRNPVVSPSQTTTYYVTASTLTCDFTDSVLVIVDSIPELLPMVDESICEGDSVQLRAMGFNAGQALYRWNPTIGLSDPNIFNPVASPAETTTYRVIADNSCSSDTQSVTVTVFDPLFASTSVVDVSCFGGADGSITAVLSGGGGNPVYSWVPTNSTGPVIDNLSAGSYTLFVADQANCRDTIITVVSEPVELSLDLVDSLNIACTGGFSGSISVQASGGTPTYEYSLNGTTWFSSGVFNNLAAGSYTLQTRDDNDCIASYGPVVLTEPALPVLGVLVNRINTDCVTAAGEITLGGSGGVSPYQFSLDGVNYLNDSTFSGLPPGNYLGWVQDSRGCIDTIMAVIQDIADPILIIDSLGMVTCFGGNDGFVSVVASGGTPGYQFALDNGPFGTVTSFSGLTAGIYTVRLQDANSCEFSVSLEITQPDSLVLELGLKKDIDCNGNNSGSIFLTASGGVEPYEYALNGGPYGREDLFENLNAGIYTMTVRDNNACVSDLVVEIVEPLPLQFSAQGNDVLCFGESSGSVRLTGTGGTLPYRYSFDNVNFIVQDSFINLPAGNYQYYIEDKNGCKESAGITISEPTKLNLALVEAIDLMCFEVPSGSIEVEGSGGTLPYEYSKNGGQTYLNSPLFTELAKGNYTILARDFNGCLAEVTADLKQPADLVGDVMKTDITCFGDSNGVAATLVEGGTLGYSFLWSTGSTASRVEDLGPGNYIVAVTDNNGCQISLSTEIFEPPLLEFDSAMFENVTCYDGMDGSAEVSVTGGLPSYLFNWSNGATDSVLNNIPAGDYSLIVSDSNMCTIDTLLSITQPDPLEINLVDVEDSYCDLPNGSITVIADGGTPNYQYTWLTQPLVQGNMLLDVKGSPQGGTYTILVIDSLGCRDSATFEINSIPSPVADFTTDFAPLDSIIIPYTLGVNFINMSQNANTYLWDFGDGGGSTEENPNHRYELDGFYEVVLIAYDEKLACPDTARRSFTLLPPGAIYVPNAFSPNDDGINDNFFPKGVGVVRMKMDIFDRWGKLLTTLYSLGDRWPGTNANGNPVQEGVYVWYIEATINDGTIFRKAGTVTLFR